MFLNVKISFTEDIINASVMFYNFVHERQYCNSDPILWVDGLYVIHTSWGSVMSHKLCE